MNRRILAAAAVVGIVGIATAVRAESIAGTQGQSRGAGNVVTVTILFQCAGTRSVTPWQVRVAQGDDIDWVLDPASDVTEFEIKKKNAQQHWVFRDERSERGRRDRPFRGRRMRDGARGTHPYNIEAQCPNPDGTTHTAVVDPDIIVD